MREREYATITNSGDHGSVMNARGEITAANRETNESEKKWRCRPTGLSDEWAVGRMLRRISVSEMDVFSGFDFWFEMRKAYLNLPAGYRLIIVRLISRILPEVLLAVSEILRCKEYCTFILRLLGTLPSGQRVGCRDKT